MGHNRGGDDAKAKLKRRLKQEKRVAAKQAKAGGEGKAEGGVLAKAKGLVEKAAHAVGDAVKAGVEKIKGHD